MRRNAYIHTHTDSCMHAERDRGREAIERERERDEGENERGIVSLTRQIFVIQPEVKVAVNPRLSAIN